MLRGLCLLLVAQLALGCSTMRVVEPQVLRQRLRAADQPIALRAQDGSTVRLDPNTEIRFCLHNGAVTRWVRGGQLWHSELGLSFGEKDGVYQLQWAEIAAAEVRNLSSGKTAAAILVTAVIVGVVVVVILGSLKGGKGGGGSMGGVFSGSGGGSRRRRLKVRGGVPRPRRRLHRRGPGGVHVHVPLIALSATHHHLSHHHVHVAPPPGTAPEQTEQGSYGDPELSGGVPTETPTSVSGQAATAGEIHAAPVFDAGMRRRFSIQLVAGAAAGTEFVRLDRYSGSLYLGMRIKDAFELGAGVRHTLAPLPPSGGEELRSSVIGFGRIGAHLGFGVSKRVALALSLDAGSGYNTLLQLKFNMGLRFKPTQRLSIGLFPFTPTFAAYKEDSDFRGALRWTFPTTLEVALNY